VSAATKWKGRAGVLALAVVMVAVALTGLGVSRAAASTGVTTAPPTLSDYWNGTADWQLAHFYNSFAYGTDPGFGAGNIFRVGPDGAWYWFYRTTLTPHSTCTVPSQAAGTIVRRSVDHGQTWTTQVPVVDPTPGTPWACAGTDGDAYWTGSQWMYLFQCEGDPAAPGPWGLEWNVCLYHNSSADPTKGAWQPVVTHPVWGDYPGGYDPWTAICTTMAKRCGSIAGGTGLVTQAGTPSIFDSPASPGWHFVDFHGVDTKGNLYQGIAKTQDFVTYVSGTGDVPSDAMFTPADATGWNEPEANWPTGDLGGGGGTVMRNPSDGMFYDVVEATNGTLCTSASVYDLGILRASTTSQVVWNQPTLASRRNPIAYSQQLTPSAEQYTNRCSPTYEELFRDPGTGQTYLAFVRRSSDNVQGVYVFTLARTLLQNGGASRCTSTAPWKLASTSAPAASFGIFRDGNYATDGGCYFGFSNDITQTVPVVAGRYTSVTLGGQFAARAQTSSSPQGYQSTAYSAGARISVVLSQYDSSGRTVGVQLVAVALPTSGQYTALPATSVSVNRATTSMAYTVKVGQSAGLTVLAGSMLLQPR
jgi:hypothetical protein